MVQNRDGSNPNVSSSGRAATQQSSSVMHATMNTSFSNQQPAPVSLSQEREAQNRLGAATSGNQDSSQAVQQVQVMNIANNQNYINAPASSSSQ